nr:type II toxin-antitoxin system RelB/DinJ family antitoxin [uncultured Gemmiger sp.]
MANVNINIRMDSDLKQQFEAFCNDVGMTMTMAFTVFAKKVVREQRIPFEIGVEVPNAETREAIQEVQRMKSDPNKVTCDSFAELLKEDARSLSETCYLSSDSQVKREIIEGMNTPLSACLPEDKMEW